jgi:hypothetical protein
MANAFANWIDTFLAEKGVDLEHTFEVPGRSGLNLIPVASLVDAMKAAPAHEQAGIKSMVVRIDFANGDVLPYFAHLARAIAL